MRPFRNVDDTLGVIYTHGFAGVIGGLLVGVLADSSMEVVPGFSVTGSLHLLKWQAFTALWVIVTLATLTPTESDRLNSSFRLPTVAKVMSAIGERLALRWCAPSETTAVLSGLDRPRQRLRSSGALAQARAIGSNTSILSASRTFSAARLAAIDSAMPGRRFD